MPQGSVLDLVLWNIAFNSILSLANDEEHFEIVYYADDTLVIITGQNLFYVRLRASVFVGRVVNHIKRPGLTAATDKIEAIVFYSKRREELLESININDVLIDFAPTIKYLGIIVDSNWSYKDHFRYVATR